jgi:hypothetical protein
LDLRQAAIVPDHLDAPPRREHRHCFGNVSLCGHERGCVEHAAIDGRLGKESLKRVTITLDLKSLHQSIDDRNIGAY